MLVVMYILKLKVKQEKNSYTMHSVLSVIRSDFKKSVFTHLRILCKSINQLFNYFSCSKYIKLLETSY